LKRTLDEVAALYSKAPCKGPWKNNAEGSEFFRLVGKGPAMLEVFDFALKVALPYTNRVAVGRPTGRVVRGPFTTESG